jgi:hypothetical protein
MPARTSSRNGALASSSACCSWLSNTTRSNCGPKLLHAVRASALLIVPFVSSRYERSRDDDWNRLQPSGSGLSPLHCGAPAGRGRIAGLGVRAKRRVRRRCALEATATDGAPSQRGRAGSARSLLRPRARTCRQAALQQQR